MAVQRLAGGELQAELLPAHKGCKSLWPVVMAILLADLVASGLLVVGRLAMNGKAGLQPVVFSWYRYLGSGLIMQLWLWASSGKTPLQSLPQRKDAWKFLVYGTCHAMGQVLLFRALKLLPAIVPSVWKNSVPVFVCALSSCVGLEQLSPHSRAAKLKLLGIGLSVVGGAIYVWLSFVWSTGHPKVVPGSDVPLGQTLMLCSTLAVSSCWVMQKVCLNCSPSSLYTVAWGVTFALVPLSLAALPQLSLEALQLSGAQLVYVAYAMLLPSTLGFLMQAWAMRHSSPAFVLAFDPLGSVITALVAWAALGEVPSAATLASAPVIMLGLAVLLLGSRSQLADPPQAPSLSGMLQHRDAEGDDAPEEPEDPESESPTRAYVRSGAVPQ
ncbi:unnamed protein product [Symbiodinium natans]|uniref:EamA domain-containing protein n=1 Tax=Symbiodinium natans TaxID=878477 RepID=A0A812LB83_9DINO|nr:unnamed protein product [Symbiodinium natans]